LDLNGCEEGTPQYTVPCQNSKVEILDKGNAMKTPFVQVLLGACLFLLLGLPLRGGPILITDDFNDNSLNTALWSPMTFGGSATLAEINQRLEFTASDGGAVAKLRGLVTGNFDLRFSYTLLTDMDSLDPDEDEPAVGVLFFDLDSFLIRSITGLPGGGQSGCIAAQVGRTIGEGCYALTSEQSGSLRLTRTGNLYTIYQWQGSAWSPLASGTSALTGPVDFYLGGGTGGQTTLGAAVDNFWLQSDGFIPEVPEPASLALVGVALGLILVIRKRRQA
jgi:hypothetical protein